MLDFPGSPLLEVPLVLFQNSLVFGMRHVWPDLELSEKHEYKILNANTGSGEMYSLDGLLVDMQVRKADTWIIGVPVIGDNFLASSVQECVAVLLGCGFELLRLLRVWNRFEYLSDRDFVIGIFPAEEIGVRLVVNLVEFFRLLECG